MALLHDAIEKNDQAMVERLLSNGADINEIDEEHSTPLIEAISQALCTPNYALIHSLLNHNVIDVNKKKHSCSKSALQIAVSKFFTRQNSLKKKRQRNQRDENKINDLNLIEKLLQKGANPNSAENSLFLPPLFEAVQYNSLDLIKLLLKYGADINQRDRHGQTALFFAIKCSFAKDKTVCYFMSIEKSKFDINLQDNKGRSLFHEVVNKNRTTLVPLFLAAQANINTYDYAGKTPWLIALENKKVTRETVDALLIYGLPFIERKSTFTQEIIHAMLDRSSLSATSKGKILTKSFPEIKTWVTGLFKESIEDQDNQVVSLYSKIPMEIHHEITKVLLENIFCCSPETLKKVYTWIQSYQKTLSLLECLSTLEETRVCQGILRMM